MADTGSTFRDVDWFESRRIESKEFTCAFCGAFVGSEFGYIGARKYNDSHIAYIYICPNCHAPNLFDGYIHRYPDVLPGAPIAHLPDSVAALYDEGRRAAGGGAYTAAVLVCRTLLMHIAVDKGAPEGLQFAPYIEWLDANDYIPKNGKAVVDYIRKAGNAATHKIDMVTREQEERVIMVMQMFLRIAYEFPASLGSE